VTPLDYDFLRRRLEERSGLALCGDKQYLVESRLLPIARKAGLGSLDALVAVLRQNTDDPLMTKVVEAMTTNETFFFRDKTPFETFRATVLPELLAARRITRSIRIWCAAASTGQEPYSLAMALKEMEGVMAAGWRIELIATDLSNEVLEKARQGIYRQFEVQRGLPIQLLIKYFAQVGEIWQIAPEVRAMVKFQRLNLLSDFSRLGTFDVVFCRNALIYFDKETKVDVLNRLGRVVARDGYLVLGAAETVVGLTAAFKTVADLRGFYAPNVRPSRAQTGAAEWLPPRFAVVNGGR
jgi:chemotaxis protein methyltransferase CheR